MVSEPGRIAQLAKPLTTIKYSARQRVFHGRAIAKYLAVGTFAAAPLINSAVIAETRTPAKPAVPDTPATLGDLFTLGADFGRNSNSRRVSIAYEVSVAQKATTHSGNAGLFIAPRHHVNLVAERTSSDNGTTKNKYGLTYTWRISGRNYVEAKTVNAILDSGEERTKLGIGFRHRLPTRKFQSSVQVGYKNAESANTQLEGRFTVRKSFSQISALPMRLTGTVKWRQRESADGDVLEDFGGTLGMRLALGAKMSLRALYNVEDDLSPEGTTIAGIYRATVNARDFAFRFGATSERTTFVGVTTRLGN